MVMIVVMMMMATAGPAPVFSAPPSALLPVLGTAAAILNYNFLSQYLNIILKQKIHNRNLDKNTIGLSFLFKNENKS